MYNTLSLRRHEGLGNGGQIGRAYAFSHHMELTEEAIRVALACTQSVPCSCFSSFVCAHHYREIKG